MTVITEPGIEKPKKLLWWRCPMDGCGFRCQKKNLRDWREPFQHILGHAIESETKLERLQVQYRVKLSDRVKL